jgi:hypothetical protein
MVPRRSIGDRIGEPDDNRYLPDQRQYQPQRRAMVLFRRLGTEGRVAEVSALKQSSLTYVVALLLILGGCAGRPDGVDPVRQFDVQRYEEKWFEIMGLDHSFERGLTNVTATNTLSDKGSVGFLNKGS